MWGAVYDSFDQAAVGLVILVVCAGRALNEAIFTDVFVCRVNSLVSRSVRALEARTCSSGYFLGWTQFVLLVKPRADFVALVRSFSGQVFKFVSN